MRKNVGKPGRNLVMVQRKIGKNNELNHWSRAQITSRSYHCATEIWIFSARALYFFLFPQCSCFQCYHFEETKQNRPMKECRNFVSLWICVPKQKNRRSHTRLVPWFWRIWLEESKKPRYSLVIIFHIPSLSDYRRTITSLPSSTFHCFHSSELPQSSFLLFFSCFEFWFLNFDVLKKSLNQFELWIWTWRLELEISHWMIINIC